MVDAGQAFTHLVQPTHLLGSTAAWMPCTIVMAEIGQVFRHTPQATQYFVSTKALGLGCLVGIDIILSERTTLD